jgi:hypothetical protein
MKVVDLLKEKGNEDKVVIETFPVNCSLIAGGGSEFKPAWLYWDKITSEWVVGQHHWKEDRSVPIYRGTDEDEAVRLYLETENNK